MSRATMALEPRTRWPLVARLRTAHPVYSGMLPQGDRVLGAIPAACAAAQTALVGAAAVLDHRVGGAVALIVVLFTAMTGLGGMRRGQMTYLPERDRVQSLCAVTGGPLGAAYEGATSALALAGARLSRVAGPPVVLIALLIDRASPTQAVLTALLFGSAPATAQVLRETVAQLAVAASDIRFPQYAYVLAGVVSGVAIHLSITRLGYARSSDDPLSELTVLAFGCVFASLAWAGPWLLPRLIEGVGTARLRFALPFTFPRARRIPMPLGLRMWLGLGRENSSVIMGFVAILTLLAINLETVGRYRPPILVSFQLAELGVFVLYAVAFITTTLVQEPLRLAAVWERLPLLRLAGVDPAREIHGLAAVIGASALLTTGTVAAALAAYGAFPSVSVGVLGGATLLSVGAATSITTLSTLRFGGLDAGRRQEELPFFELMIGAFGCLLPGVMAVGWSVETPDAGTTITTLVAAGLVVVLALSVTRVRLVVRGRVRKALS